VNAAYGTGLRVSNNFIVEQGSNPALTCNNNADLAVVFNSVNVTGTGSALSTSLSLGTLTLENNILSSSGGGYAYDMGVYGGALVIDYNDYLAWGPQIARWNGVGLPDFAAMKSASGQDAHSLFTPPGYASSTDLHTFVRKLNGAGIPVAGVTTDFDGQTRDSVHPDIGADEFTPTNTGVEDLPTAWAFASPSPNPSRTLFRIGFDLPSAQRVRVTLFDVAGRQALTPLADQAFAPGRYSLIVRTEALAPGLYFCRIHAGPFEETARVIVGR